MKLVNEGVFLDFGWKDSSTGSLNYWFTDATTGYVYKDYGYYKSYAYTPTGRPWYIAATTAGTGIFGDPYVYSDGVTLGITYSVPIYSAGDTTNAIAVVAVDLTLGDLDKILSQYGDSGFVYYLMETNGDRAFNMLASSSEASVSYLNYQGTPVQSTAINASAVNDFYIYNSAKYMNDNSITANGNFVTGNLSCSVLNYNNNGVSWRIVGTSYVFPTTSSGSGGNTYYNSNDDETIEDHDMATLILTVFTFVGTCLLVIGTGYIYITITNIQRSLQVLSINKIKMENNTGSSSSGSGSGSGSGGSDNPMQANKA